MATRQMKHRYLQALGIIIIVLALVRCVFVGENEKSLYEGTEVQGSENSLSAESNFVPPYLRTPVFPTSSKTSSSPATPTAAHRPSRSAFIDYAVAFNDSNHVQLVVAQQWGVPPVKDREDAEQRKQEKKDAAAAPAAKKVSLDDLFSQIQVGEVKELKVIVKADVQGSAEAVRQNLEKLSNDEVRVRVIHSGVGAINESDVMLASTSNAIIVGFSVRPDNVARNMIERDKVDVRLYRVIYDCIEEIESAMKGLLAPKFREVELGRVEVREVYKITGAGVIAGCYVKEGKVVRSAQIRLVRDGVVIHEGTIASLRRFKDDVKEVATNFECGIGLEKFSDIKVGDIFEVFQMEQVEV